MAVATELILTLVMGGISVFLIRTILVIRNRRFRFASEGQDDYSGDAKNPDSLSNPDSDALEDMDYLMKDTGICKDEKNYCSYFVNLDPFKNYLG